MAESIEEDPEIGVNRPGGVFRSCSFCKLCFQDIRNWLSHIRLVHGSDPDFSMQCGIDGCSNIFRTFSGFNTHVYRYHRDKVCKEPVDTPQEVDIVVLRPPVNDDDYSAGAGSRLLHLAEFNDDESSAHVLEADVAQLLGEDSEEQKKATALFLLEMREKFAVSQVAINGIVTGCEKLFTHLTERIEAGVMHHLSKSGVDTENIPDVKAFFTGLQSPFVGLTSDFLQHKYYRDQFGLIVRLSVNFSMIMLILMYRNTLHAS